MIPHPRNSLDLAPADFFFFPRVKSELAVLSLPQDSFQKSRERVVQNITQFAAAFWWWMERCKKCLQIRGNYVKK